MDDHPDSINHEVGLYLTDNLSKCTSKYKENALYYNRMKDYS